MIGSLSVGDQAHHHLAIGFIFLSLTEAYFLTPLPVNTNSNRRAGPAERCGAESVGKAGGGLAVSTSGTAQDIHSITPYYYLSYDYYA